jgi:hypothetical protein
MYADPTLPNHVIYQPKNPAGLKLPVIVWGNGQCYGDGTIFQAFLGQVASFGVFVIAGGQLGTGVNNRVNAANMEEGISWAVKNAGTGNYTHVDASRLAVWGQSCGGLLAIQNAADPRVTSVGIWNSGSTMIGGRTSQVSGLKKPIFYFIGGTCDMAYTAVSLYYNRLCTLWMIKRYHRRRGTTNLSPPTLQLGRATFPSATRPPSLRKTQADLAWLVVTWQIGFSAEIKQRHNGLQVEQRLKAGM